VKNLIDGAAGGVLSPSEAVGLVARIVARLRDHPDVVRGPSVGGAIAFREVVEALAGLTGGMTREAMAKGALITLPPRISVKQTADSETIVSDIIREILFGIRPPCMQDEASDQLGSSSMRPDDIMASLAEIQAAMTRQDLDAANAKRFAVAPGKAGREESHGHWEKLYRSAESRGRYFTAKRAVMSLISSLEARLRAGEITPDEFEKQRARLMAGLRSLAGSEMHMSGRELASTIIEMMDAQDKQWNSEVSFSRMHMYYHIKGTCDGEKLNPFKEDYHALKWLIDDLQTQSILRPTDDAAGFLLTSVALDVLLSYLTDGRTKEHGSQVKQELIGSPLSYRSEGVRRYSRGDRFRDLSVRHTLREIAKRGHDLAQLKEGDLRIFMKEHREPRRDIILCIDTSGSMGFHQKLTYARLAAAGLVKAACQDGNRAGLVAFRDLGQTIVRLTGKCEDLLLNGIAGLSANGNTNIGDGIRSARELLLDSGSRNSKHLILITDGQASAVSEEAFARLSSPKGRDPTEESALFETSRAADAGVQLSVVYVAPRDEEIDRFVRDVADVGRGKIYRMSGLADLRNMLSVN